VTFHYFRDKVYCDVHRLTFLSSGTCPKCAKVVSSSNDEQLRANDDQLRGVSIKPTRKYVRRSKSSIYERFHNFGVKFKAKIQQEALFKLESHRFGRTEYKRLDFPEAIVKVFKESILITLRANQEIKGMNVKDAEFESLKRVNGVLDRLPKAIVISDRSIVNVHNAFVNHPFAKHDLNVKVNGETRLISDHSKGLNEFEAVNPVYAKTDSEKIEEDTIGLIDKGLSREFLACSINKLVEDREYYAENLKSHVQAIKDLDKGINRFSSLLECPEGVSSRSPLFPSQDFSSPERPVVVGEGSQVLVIPETLSRFDIESKSKKYRLWRAQQLLKEFGWGGAIW